MSSSAPTSPFGNIIRASAGSGKTTELASQFIQLLDRGEKPERILATTFTRKAAGEIRERIFRRLLRAAAGLDDLTGGVNPARARELLLHLVRNQHRLSITTMDGFFTRVAQAFALELGLEPGWRLADELGTDRLVNEALAGLLDRDQREGEGRFIERFLLHIERGRRARSARSRLLAEVGAFHGFSRQVGSTAWQWLESEGHRAPSQSALREQLVAIAEELSRSPLPCTKAGEPSKQWGQGVRALVRQLAEVPRSWHEWSELCRVGILKNFCGGATYYNGEYPPELAAALTALRDLARRWLLAALSSELRETAHFVEVFDEEYRAVQRRTNLLTFDDVSTRLAQAAGEPDLAELYYRIDTRVHHLMLDEFQDTSRDQWEVLLPIADEIAAKLSVENTFFCVGDTKQAIYGWRGGVAEIFDSLTLRWPHLSERSIDLTYRCAPAIVKCVNTIFDSLSSNPALATRADAAVAWQRRFRPHRSAWEEPEGAVRLFLVAGEESDAGSHEEEGVDEDGAQGRLLPAVVERVVQIVVNAARGDPDPSIGILLRRNESVSQVRRALQRRDIPASEEGGNPLTDSAAVLAVLALFRYLDHPGDRLARAHLEGGALTCIPLVASCVAESSRERGIQAFRARCATRGLGEVLRELLCDPEVGYLGRWSGREARRLEQLLSLAYTFERDHGVFPRFEPFLSYVEKTPVEDVSAQRVRVMTVHQAKGLEFDRVILPELEEQIDKVRFGAPLLWRDSPLATPSRICRAVGAEFRALEPRLQEMVDQAIDAQVRDALSLLYVALTRARRWLDLIVVEPRTSPAEVDGGEEKRGSKRKKSHVRLSFASLIQGAYASRLSTGNREVPIALHGELERTEVVEKADLPLVVEHEIERRGAPLASFLAPARLRDSTVRAPSAEISQRFSDLPSARSSSQGREDGRRFGEEVHRLLARIQWGAPDVAPVPAEGAATVRRALENSEIAELFLHDRYLARWSGESVDHCSVYTEMALRWSDSEGGASGVLDRLVVGMAGDTPRAAEVVEFKTTAAPAEGSEEGWFAPYQAQVSRYCEAVASLLGIERAAVSGVVVFLGGSKPKLVWVVSG